MSTSPQSPLSRRAVLGATAAIGATVPLTALGLPEAHAEPRPATGPGWRAASVRSAVRFLQGVTDAYRSDGLRLAQSYDDSRISDIAFIYDEALTTIALLASGDLRRAKAIGDALLYAQNHDEAYTDGRLRQAYHANTFVNPDPKQTAHFGWEYGLIGTAVGDMAWTGLAFAQLAHRTGAQRYLTGATRIGQWIVDHTYSTGGLGGYTFGETSGLERHKSTEHNLDVYGLFHLLAKLTGDRSWLSRAQHALQFIEAAWNAVAGFFWTGSDDGIHLNTNPAQLPLDVQAWSWLSVHQARYGAALDWAATNLATTDTPQKINSALTGNYAVTGVAFSSGTFKTDVRAKVGGHDYTPYPDDSAVWFEGTGQLACALRLRSHRGDRAAAAALLAALRSVQEELGHGQTFNGRRIQGGVVAASSPLDTGFGYDYSPDLHIAATSWYIFAATGSNPYRFG